MSQAPTDTAPQPPVLLFDGACGFCTRCVDWLAPRLARPVRVVPWQRSDLAALGVTEAEAAEKVWWIEPDGARHGGADGVARALEACRPPWPRAGRALRAPGIGQLARLGYWAVARWRRRLPGTEPALHRERNGDRDGAPGPN